MSDRQRVVYKTPLHRFLELVLVLVNTVVIATLVHWLFPNIAASLPIAVALIAGLIAIPRLGTEIAIRRGGELMSPAERSRRYLREIGPLMPWGQPPRMLPGHSRSRMSPGRARRG